jgi:hypothetical protein
MIFWNIAGKILVFKGPLHFGELIPCDRAGVPPRVKLKKPPYIRVPLLCFLPFLSKCTLANSSAYATGPGPPLLLQIQVNQMSLSFPIR